MSEESKVDPKDKKWYTHLLKALVQPHIDIEHVRALIEGGADVFEEVGPHISAGRLDFRYLGSMRSHVPHQHEKESALEIAITRGHSQAFDLILKKAISEGGNGHYYAQCITTAISSNHLSSDQKLSFVNQLLDAGAEVNRKTYGDQSSLLGLALQGGYTDIALLLLDRGADSTAITPSKPTLLSLAASCKDRPEEILNAMLQKYDDPLTHGHNLYSSAWGAIEEGDIVAAKMLVQKAIGIGYEVDGSSLLCAAAQYQDAELVEFFIEMGFKNSEPNAIQAAIQRPDPNIAKLIIANSAPKAFARNPHYDEHLEMTQEEVSAYLPEGATLPENAVRRLTKDSELGHHSQLDRAIRYKQENPDFVRARIKSGEKVNAEMIIVAAQRGLVSTLAAFRDEGVKVDSRDWEKIWSGFIGGAKKSDAVFVGRVTEELLKFAGCTTQDFFVTDDRFGITTSKTPLVVAIEGGFEDAALHLVAHHSTDVNSGAKMKKRNEEDAIWSPLSKASKFGALKIANALLAKGAKVGMSEVIDAIKSKNLDLVNAVLEKLDLAHFSLANHSTIMCFGVISQDMSIVNALLQKGIIPSAAAVGDAAELPNQEITESLARLGEGAYLIDALNRMFKTDCIKNECVRLLKKWYEGNKYNGAAIYTLNEEFKLSLNVSDDALKERIEYLCQIIEWKSRVAGKDTKEVDFVRLLLEKIVATCPDFRSILEAYESYISIDLKEVLRPFHDLKKLATETYPEIKDTDADGSNSKSPDFNIKHSEAGSYLLRQRFLELKSFMESWIAENDSYPLCKSNDIEGRLLGYYLIGQQMLEEISAKYQERAAEYYEKHLPETSLAMHQMPLPCNLVEPFKCDLCGYCEGYC